MLKIGIYNVTVSSIFVFKLTPKRMTACLILSLLRLFWANSLLTSCKALESSRSSRASSSGTMWLLLMRFEVGGGRGWVWNTKTKKLKIELWRTTLECYINIIFNIILILKYSSIGVDFNIAFVIVFAVVFLLLPVISVFSLPSVSLRWASRNEAE